MKTAFIFPGQGSQQVAMGMDLYQSDLRDDYDFIDNLFAQYHQDSIEDKLSDVVFNGPIEELTKTVFTQPAILTMSMVLAKQIKAKIKNGDLHNPAFVAGHSLGEFSALYMADVLSFADAAKLVIARAALMQNAPQGAMSAILGLGDEVLNELTAKYDDVSVANYNSPDQVVITGSKEGVAKISAEIEEYASQNSLKVRVIALNVGGAFHSPLMQEPAEQFATLIDEIQFNNASIPVIQNVTATAVTDAQEIKENLKKQMTGSVRWTETVQFLFTNQVTEILELGPGKVLAGLVKKQDRRFPVKNIDNLEALNSLEVSLN
jgi:[acyl-carrier-protein] S-malonyltransferase